MIKKKVYESSHEFVAMPLQIKTNSPRRVGATALLREFLSIFKMVF
jgi:hypothetical protein